MKLDYEKIGQVIEKAKNENLKEIIIGTDVEVIENGCGGLVYSFIFLDKNKIEFTTDVPDYIEEELENRLEKLFNNFRIGKFEIVFHHHKGDFHDKDIRFSLENSEDLPEVIRYILQNFYKSQNFDYCFK